MSDEAWFWLAGLLDEDEGREGEKEREWQGQEEEKG